MPQSWKACCQLLNWKPSCQASKLAAQLPGAVDHLPGAAVAAREPGLVQRDFGIDPGELEPRPAQRAAQQVLFGADIVDRVARDPLEGGVRFGDEGAHPGMHARPAADPPPAFLQHGFAHVERWPATSSMVSEGWPIIKYSLIEVQPWA